MAAPSHHYANGIFNEDLSPAPRSSPPPPYHAVPDRRHCGSASHPQGQASPFLTAFRALTGESPTHGHAASISPTSAYTVLASEVTGAQGHVHHHSYQMAYPGIGYPPGSPPIPRGFPPPRSPPQSPTQTHIVHQPLPTHTGRDSGVAVASSTLPALPVPAHQPISVPTSTHSASSCPSANTTSSTNSTSSANSTPPAKDTAAAAERTEPPWTESQDRLLRLRKNELSSYLGISADLEKVFQVKRSEHAVKKRLAHLKARRKVWSEEQLKQAAQRAMESFTSVTQHELASSLNSNDNEQSVAIGLAVRLKLEKMLAQGEARKMQERMVSEQKEINAQYRTSVEQKEHSPEREWEQVDDDGDEDQASSGDDYEVLDVPSLSV